VRPGYVHTTGAAARAEVLIALGHLLRVVLEALFVVYDIPIPTWGESRRGCRHGLSCLRRVSLGAKVRSASISVEKSLVGRRPPVAARGRPCFSCIPNSSKSMSEIKSLECGLSRKVTCMAEIRFDLEYVNVSREASKLQEYGSDI